MKVLSHSVHSGYEYLFRYLPWEVYQVHEFEGKSGLPQEVQWLHDMRPVPDNVHLMDEIDYDIEYDFILAQHHRTPIPWKTLAAELECPMMLKLHTFGNDVAAKWLLNNVRPIVTVANSREVLESWWLDGPEAFAALMPFPITEGWTGELERAIYVGSDLASDKRNEKLTVIMEQIGVDVYGFELAGLPGEVLDRDSLADAERKHRVFINIRPYLTMSPLEAMAVGCPVVSFPIRNYKTELGPVVPQAKSLQGVIDLARELIDNKALAEKASREQQAAISEYFTIDGFVATWTSAVTALLNH